MIATVAGKWIFEGIIGQPVIEVILFAVAILLVLPKHIYIKKYNAIWLLYIISIGINICTHNLTISSTGRAILMCEIVLFVILAHFTEQDFSFGLKLLTVVGIIKACTVILQWLLKENFNDIYFPMLRSEEMALAQNYFSRGYYFGFTYNPHEVAGLAGFAFGTVFLCNILKHEKKHMVLLAVLSVALLLTQKKGILILYIFSVFLVVMVQYGSRNDWARMFFWLLLIGITAWVLLFVVIPKSNSELFYRMRLFLEAYASGASYDAGRTPLLDIAVKEWREHPILGIGWGKYSSLLLSKYGYARSHYVNRDYLQWLCEMGIVGFCLNIIPVAVSFYKTIYVAKKMIRRIDAFETRLLTLFAISIQIFIVAYAWIEMPFYDGVMFFVYMFSAVIISSIYAQKDTLDIERVRGI